MTEALHVPDPPISHSGFHLRPWAATDVPALVAAWQDPEMHRWMPEETNPFGAEQARAFVDEAAAHLARGPQSPSPLPMDRRTRQWDL
jgi:RimJ/RimL family protein N-acetyltransferase